MIQFKQWAKGRRKLILLTGASFALIGLSLKAAEELFYEEPGEISRLWLWDHLALDWFSKHRNASLNQVMLTLTALGSMPVLVAICLIIVSALIVRGKKWGALQVALASLGSAGLTWTAKHFFERARPAPSTSIALAPGFAFPSGHSLSTSAIFITIALIFCRDAKHTRTQISLILTASSLALLVGLSRIYLGVHYPSDVMSGLCLGSGFAFALESAFLKKR